MLQTSIEIQYGPWVGERPNEYVERKGLGHPDTICDAIAEAMSVALCQAYLAETGRVLHYNLDKNLLVAGQSKLRFGGGEILQPMQLYIGDRATFACNGKKIQVNDIVTAAAKKWIRKNLRHVDPDIHFEFRSELRPGSLELTGIYPETVLRANDTSIGVGYAPLTEAENIVLQAESIINSAEFKKKFPMSGEDVKVMAVRRECVLHLTVAIAFIAKFIKSERAYFEAKDAVAEALLQSLQPLLREIRHIELVVNALDKPGCGLDGVYLTVLGTSADSADSGEVGRGNRVNGLTSFSRHMSMEAAAGKNPMRHVGKLYNVLAQDIARKMQQTLPRVKEVCIWLCSQIGAPVGQPNFSTIRLILEDQANVAEVERRAQEVFHQELTQVDELIGNLIKGKCRLC